MEKSVERREAPNLRFYRVDQGGFCNGREIMSYFEGTLEGVYYRDMEIKATGQIKRFFWFEILTYGENSTKMILRLGEYHPSLLHILVCLASYERLNGFSNLRFESFLDGNGRTKVSIFAEGTRLGWGNLEIPRDQEQRRLFVLGLCDKIRRKIERYP